MTLAQIQNIGNEALKSREVVVKENGFRITRVYHVTRSAGAPVSGGVIDPEQILNFLPAYGEAHPDQPSLLVRDARVTPIDDEGVRVVISWEPVNVDPRENSAGEIWTWNLESAQSHITNVKSDADQDHYPSGEDVGTVIGLDDDTVHGADVYRPRQVIEVRKRYQGLITTNFRRQLKDAQNSINSNGWFEFSAREVLFIGSRIEPLGGNEWAIDFLFNVGPTQTIEVELADGSSETITDVGPWDHVWYKYVDEGDDSGGQTVKSRRIKSVHVARVYDEISFSLLGLSGP